MILQTTDVPVKLVFLSLLVDLCEYEESVTYLVTWCSNKNSENLLTMLCHLWRQEENTLCVKRTADGCILGIVQCLNLFSNSHHDLINNGNCACGRVCVCV